MVTVSTSTGHDVIYTLYSMFWTNRRKKIRLLLDVYNCRGGTFFKQTAIYTLVCLWRKIRNGKNTPPIANDLPWIWRQHVLRNVVEHLQDYTMSKPRKIKSEWHYYYYFMFCIAFNRRLRLTLVEIHSYFETLGVPQEAVWERMIYLPHIPSNVLLHLSWHFLKYWSVSLCHLLIINKN
jgi:hypothetical protein